MNIGILMPTMGVTGGVRRVVEIANRLVQSKHNVTIYNLEKNVAKWMKPIKLLYQQKRLDDIHSERKKDVWLCGWPNFTDDIYDTVIGNNKFFMIQHIEKSWISLIKKPDWSTISFSTYAHNWTKSHCFADKHFKVLGGLNTDIFNSDINEEIKERMKRIDKRKFIVLGYPRKGAKYIVKALDILKNKNIELELFGNPKIDNCHKSKYFNGKYYHGLSQDEIAKVYKRADLYVSLQTPRACWNNPVAEAMACGCPVITTQIGAVEDLLCPGIQTIPILKHCLNDENAFVNNLAKRIKDMYWLFSIYKDSHIEKFTKCSYDKVQQFSWNKIFPEFLKVLQNEK